MRERMSFIYSLEFPEGNVRYIGKTKDIKKRYRGHIDKVNTHVSHKNSWIKSLLSKGEVPIMNIVDTVPDKEWQFWEEHYIWLYRSFGFDLTNSTFGGDGASNLSQETKDKIRKSVLKCYENGVEPWNKGTKGIVGGWNKGIVRTEGQKKKISDTKKKMYASGEIEPWNKGKETGQVVWNKGTVGLMPEPWNKGTKGVMVAWNKGVPMSEESKKKCSINSTRSKSVRQFTLEGEHVRDFPSAKEANDHIKCKGVSPCCNNITRSAGGFLWLWVSECNEESIKRKVQEYRDKSLNKSRGKGSDNHCAKKVLQLDPETREVIKTFGSITEARAETGKGNVGRACREGVKANGFYWEYDNN